jgi:alpha-N-acetylglucosamine transferase
MKWGTKYGPEYVNRLQGMVARNLTIPHRFVCFTDDRTGLNDAVEALPLPDLGLSLTGPERGWNKLATFEKDLFGLQGEALFLDLDIVIVGSLDPFFSHPGQVLIIKDWLKRDGTGNSSVYRFTLGQYSELLADFRANFGQIKVRYRNEQEFLSAYFLARNMLHYWPDSWCRSFKRHCMHAFPKSLFVPPALPSDARVLVFHGHPHPDEALAGVTGKWYRFARPARWIADFWRV